MIIILVINMRLFSTKKVLLVIAYYYFFSALLKLQFHFSIILRDVKLDRKPVKLARTEPETLILKTKDFVPVRLIEIKPY